MVFNTSLSIVLIIMITAVICIIPALYIIDKKVDDLIDLFWENYWKGDKDEN